MKTLPARLLAMLAVSSLFASFARANEKAYADILKQREAILSQILTEREGRAATGLADDEAVLAARGALYSFRRDTAPSPAEKIRQQELIVALYEKKLAMLKSRAATGVVGPEDVLLATDLLLQAQQKLEELKREGKSS